MERTERVKEKGKKKERKIKFILPAKGKKGKVSQGGRRENG